MSRLPEENELDKGSCEAFVWAGLPIPIKIFRLLVHYPIGDCASNSQPMMEETLDETKS